MHISRNSGSLKRPEPLAQPFTLDALERTREASSTSSILGEWPCWQPKR